MKIKLIESITLRSEPISAGTKLDLPELDARQLIQAGHAEEDADRIPSRQHAEQADDSSAEYLHKGIARRSFKLSLRLDEHIEVQRADYTNGLLKIELQRIVPEEKLPRQIPIGRKAEPAEPSQAE